MKEKKESILHFFTPYLGDRNVLLAHTKYWVQEFAKNFDKVIVYSVHLDSRMQFSDNVVVQELGGGTLFKRLVAFGRLNFAALTIVVQRQSVQVFYHMIPKLTLVVGTLLKLRKSKQVLWYSHSAKTSTLYLAEKLVSVVVTPTSHSFPIRSNKVVPVGHGIPTFGEELHKSLAQVERSKEVLFLGRISPIKRLEKIIQVMDKSMAGVRKFVAIGPILDSNYFHALERLAETLGIDLEFRDAIPLVEIGSALSKSSFFFTGSPRTLDKASAQAAIYGCFVLSEEEHVLEAIGMSMVWKNLGYSTPPDIVTQIEVLASLDLEKSTNLRWQLMQNSFKLNRLDQTVKKIVGQLKA